MSDLASCSLTAEECACRVTLGPGWGWTKHQVGDDRVFVKGYLFEGVRTFEGEPAARMVAHALSGISAKSAVNAALERLSGHFAFVLVSPHRVVAAVDRIRSVPLFFGSHGGKVLVDDRARRLRDHLGLGIADLDRDQALAVAMSGYTIGDASLYTGLTALRPGEALFVEMSGVRKVRWFIYDAWNTERVSNPERRLSELNRMLMERLATSATGRTICVPLSAGYDSRLIAAGLKAVGNKDVRLFSYGRPGNHEAETARQIAERLGYPWRFVPFTTASQTEMFADHRHVEALWNTSDTCCSVPFEQDWRAIDVLRRDGYIPSDAIVVNGQSGDFISGNHAPLGLLDLPRSTGVQERQQAVLTSFVSKHFRLWRALATPVNDRIVARLLAAEAQAAGVTFGSEQELAGIHEMLEYQDRQVKYVVSGQRTYEAMGLSWRLPLWDDEYVLFWRRIQGPLKRQQSLYKRVIESDNWGGVFRGIPVNAKTISPEWIKPIRLAAKLAFAPLGADRWHQAERRLFGWWMDPLRTSAAVSYGTWLRDSYGARHAISWLSRRYLERHALDLETLC